MAERRTLSGGFAAVLVLLLLLTTATVTWADTSFEGLTGGDSIDVTGTSRESAHAGRQKDPAVIPIGGKTGVAQQGPAPCENIDYTAAGENSYYIDLNGCLRAGGGRIGQEFLVTLPPEPDAPAEEAPPAVPIVVTAEDLQRLPIAPGGLTVQPDRGWVLVNLETIVWTDAAEQTFSTVVLGTPVQVRVEPIDYTWDFGDGSAPLVTSDPGAPFPNHSISHTYTSASAQRQVTLTTRWAGEFEVNGSGVWQPVSGVATTSETSRPFEVRTAETSLVNG